MLCGSFGRAPPKLKRIYYNKDTKQKDHMIFSNESSFCHTGLSLNNANIFCL